LLACLGQTDVPQKTDILWSVALNRQESQHVRRTAVFLISTLPDPSTHTDQLLELLNDPDGQVSVYALQCAGAHQDDRVYDRIKEIESTTRDVHVRVAAIKAIGASEAPSSDTHLHQIIDACETSRADKFSKESLVKRAAVSALDVAAPSAYERLQKLALDLDEEPGVRRRAILKCAESDNPHLCSWLLDLLASTSAADAIVLKGCVEGINLIGELEDTHAAMRLIDALDDAALRTVLARSLVTSQQRTEGPYR